MARRRSFGTILERRGRTGFYVRFHHEGRQVERYGGPTEKIARAQLSRLHALLASRVPLGQVMGEVFGDLDGSTLTFRKAVEKYLEHAEARKRESTLRGDRSRLRILADAPWAGKHLASIRPGDLLPWIAARRSPTEVTRRRARRPGETLGAYRRAADKLEKVKLPGCSGATVNRDLALASALYRWAIRAGLATENPIRDVERFSEKGRAREVYLTAEECHALIYACSPTIRPLVLAAIHTGMRRGELLGLRWRGVDPKRRVLVVEPETEKAGRGRTVRMTSTLASTLAGLRMERPTPALDGSDHVFVLSDGAPLDVETVRDHFLEAVQRADLAEDKRSLVTFHTLRHTAASLLVAAGVPLFDVAKILGHSTLAVTMRYAHFAPQAGKDAADRLSVALRAPARALRRGRA